MRKEIIFVVGSLVGASIGSVTTYFVMKAKYEKIFKEETDSIMEEVNSGYTVDPSTKEKLMKNWEKPNLKSVEEELAETEHPVDSDEDENDEDPDEERSMNLAIALEDEKREVENDPPRIISEEEMGELSPGWDEREWNYYIYDDIMTDDDGNKVEDYKLFIGEALSESGFIDEEETDEVIVLSGEFSTVYRIHKIMIEYEYKNIMSEYT